MTSHVYKSSSIKIILKCHFFLMTVTQLLIFSNLKNKTDLLPLRLHSFDLLLSCEDSEPVHPTQNIVCIFRHLSLTAQIHSAVMLSVKGLIEVNAISHIICFITCFITCFIIYPVVCAITSTTD